MKTIFESILEKAPWFIRWVFYIFWAGAIGMAWLFWQGWSAKDKSDKYFSAIASDVFDEKMAPIKAARDTQINGIEARLNSLDNRMEGHGRILYRMEGKLDQALSDKR